jgi:hypothetical protein
MVMQIGIDSFAAAISDPATEKSMAESDKISAMVATPLLVETMLSIDPATRR